MSRDGYRGPASHPDECSCGDCGPLVDSRERTALQEAVIRAAVRVHNAGNPDCDEAGFLEVDTAIRALDAAVDALLAAEPAWGEGK